MSGTFCEVLGADLLDKAKSLQDQAFGEHHLHSASLIKAQGMMDGLRGRYDDGLASFRRALEMQEKKLGSQHGKVLRTKRGIALMCIQVLGCK